MGSPRFLSWLSWISKHQSRWSRQEKTTRLILEAMEDRVLPALTWSAGVALPGALSGAAAVLETDQSILVLGGGSAAINQLAIAGTAWSAANPIDQARLSPAVSPIGGSEVLVYGGSVGGTATNTALEYDPTIASNIHAVAAMSTPRSLMAFASDGLSRAYAIGGIDAGGNRLASVERFDPGTGTWSMVASLPQAISGATAAYDGIGAIYVFGGATNSSSRTRTALKYTVATNTWTTLPSSMTTSTSEAAAVLGPDGLFYVIGGKGSEGALATVQTYNPSTKKWSTGTSLPSGVSDEAVVVDAQRRIEVIGGKTSSGRAVAAVYTTQSLANFAPQITTATALPGATAGAPYAATVAAIGSPAPSFMVVAGPPGLRIDPTTGTITWTTPGIPQIGTQSVTVQAQNVVGTTQQTFTLLVTPDATPPSVPLLSVGTITTTSDIPLNWGPSTDNVGVAGYRLYTYTPAVYRGHSGRDGGITLVSPAKYTLLVDNIPATATSYTVTGLAPNSTKQFALAAFDAAGNRSGYSAVVSGTTLLAPGISYYVGSSTNPPLAIVANHQLYFTLGTTGNPAPTLSLISAPDGVVFTPGMITNSQLTIVIPNITWTPTAAQVGAFDIIMQATNSVGTATLDIPVTVTADLPIPSLTVNGGLAYTMGNFTPVAGTPNAYQVAVNSGFDITGGIHPQYAFVGTPFTFQVTGTSNTNPTTYVLVSGPATMSFDQNSGIGTWTPTASDASAATSITVSATNSAGTTYLTFTFPTYFTSGPSNVAVTFNTSVSSSVPATWIPVVTWTAPSGGTAVADYKVTATDLNKNTATVYDTQSTATSFALPAGIADQNSISVTAYDANGNPSQASTNVASLYLVALGTLSWTPSMPIAVVGQPLSVQFSGGGTPYAIVSGPAGLGGG
jgi:hypothetical protein